MPHRVVPMICGALILFAAGLSAQETAPATQPDEPVEAAATQPVAAPSEPAPELHALPTEDLNARLRRWVEDANARAPVARLVAIGKSVGGESILAVEIGKPLDAGPLPADAPGAARRLHGRRSALLVVAGIEGELLLGTSIATHLVERVLALPAEEIETLLGGRALYVVPRVSPDGAARRFRGGPAREGGNARAIDEDRDGRRDEDGPNDIDGDGLILDMRVRNAAGIWMVDPGGDRLMRRAKPQDGEQGAWDLFPEARDEDADGLYGEDGSRGVDVSRNFPHGFSEHDQMSGAWPASEPEAHALLDYVLARGEIEMIVTLGAHDNLEAVPEAAKPDEGGERGRGGRLPALKLDRLDREIHLELSKLFKEHVKAGAKNSGVPGGAFHEWAYFHFGVPSLAANPFEVPEDAKAPEAPATAESQPAEAPQADPVAAAKAAVARDAFRPWTPFQHPDLGEVEIGGWVPFARQSPPPAVAHLIAERWFGFVKGLLGHAARLEIGEPRLRQLTAGLHEIEIDITNSGRLPTALRQGVLNRRGGPVIVLLETTDEQLIQGERRRLFERFAAGGAEKLRWLVRVPSGTTVRLLVSPPKSHVLVKEIVLP